ncbi:MAG: BTAD domain-containing putative transcriptional regulator [Kibdelosporangium sp.]
MQFNLLGPLEVVHDGQPVPLSGFNQRATLGFLLLHANTVVATRTLLKALWGGDPPATARKILQNAIGGLRAALSPRESEDSAVALLTHAPGYLLRVRPEQVDVCRFQALAEQGRTELVAGSWQAAATTLHAALDLWRGPLLVDLTESGGIDWPELATIQEARLATLEDFVEAELARGRHQEVIGDLEAAAELGPPRERLRGMLMLALYRSGRQADALNVYRRTRITLATELGLDPSHELQQLERAILAHDPELALTPSGTPWAIGHALPGRDSAPVDRAVLAAPEPAGDSSPATTSGTEPTWDSVRVERKWVSVLLVQADRHDHGHADDPEDVDKARRLVTATVREQVERFGGVLRTVMGSVWLAVFGLPRTHEDDAERAVRAGFAIRGELTTPPGTDGPRRSVQVAVATGEALMTTRRDKNNLPSTDVTGEVLDSGMRLLSVTPPGEMRVSTATQHASPGPFTYATSDGPFHMGDVTAIRPEHVGGMLTVPFDGREHEKEALHRLFEEVVRRRRPHLLTLLGEPGIGKSRLVAEFGQAIDKQQFLVGRTPRFGCNTSLIPLAGIVKSHVDEVADSAASEPERLDTTIHDLFGSDHLAEQVLTHMHPLVSLRENVPATVDLPTTFAAWRRFLEEIAARRPTVVVLENLHWAEDALLDFVEHLDESLGPVPLLLICTARPELLHRRPSWGGGKHNATMITLDPLSPSASIQLLGRLLVRHGILARPAPGESIVEDVERELGLPTVSRVGGNPLFAGQYVGVRYNESRPDLGDLFPALHISSAGPVDSADDLIKVPLSVHNIIAAQLDTLSQAQKAVLQDAAVFGETVYEDVIPLLGEHDKDEVARCLRYLDRRGFLRRTRQTRYPDRTAYAIQYVLVRDVAYSQLSRASRAEKHYRCTMLLEGTDESRLLAHHYRRARTLAVAAGLPLQKLAIRARQAMAAGHEAYPNPVPDPVTAGR